MDQSTFNNIQGQLSGLLGSIASPGPMGSVALCVCISKNYAEAKGAGMQSITEGLNAIGAGFGAITSTQSGLLQNTMAMVTMMLNTMRGTITSINSSALAMVRGQRAAS
jgi:hypothetical protein